MSVGVTAQWELRRSLSFCVRCAFCSVWGHFDVNGYSDECASFCRDPYCAGRAEGRGLEKLSCSYLYVYRLECRSTQTHTKKAGTIESLVNTIAACWVEFSHRKTLSPKTLWVCRRWTSVGRLQKRIYWINFVLLMGENCPFIA